MPNPRRKPNAQLIKYRRKSVAFSNRGLVGRNSIWRRAFRKGKGRIPRPELESDYGPNASLKEIGKKEAAFLRKYHIVPNEKTVHLWQRVILKTAFKAAQNKGSRNIWLFRDALRFDPDPVNRAFAVDVLRLWKDKKSVPWIMKVFKHQDSTLPLQFACARALRRMAGRAEKTELRRLAKGEDVSTADFAKLALATAKQYEKVLQMVKEKHLSNPFE